MTILFLDFDGVLHPDAAFLEKGRPVLRTNGDLFMWAPYLIEALSSHPRVKIVLSTSWVRVLGYKQAVDALPKLLRQRVIGATWHSVMTQSDYNAGLPLSFWNDATRYQQIAHYVKRARLARWVAIDDHGEEWADIHCENLIQTDPDKGVSDPIAMTRLQAMLTSPLGNLR